MVVSKLSVGYEEDFSKWLEQTVDLLKERRFEELDIDSLIDELEGLSKRDQREILSRLKVLLMHLLKWQYQSLLFWMKHFCPPQPVNFDAGE